MHQNYQCTIELSYIFNKSKDEKLKPLVVQAPKCAGSVAATLGLSCSEACGILVPQPGIKPTSLTPEGRFLMMGPPRKSLKFFFQRMP